MKWNLWKYFSTYFKTIETSNTTSGSSSFMYAPNKHLQVTLSYIWKTQQQPNLHFNFIHYAGRKGHVFSPKQTFIHLTQLSNLWWMPNSVSKVFDTAMRTGSSRRFKRYPTTYRWVSSQLPFTVDSDKPGLALIQSKGKTTWNSHIGYGVSFESSWWARFHGSVKTYAYWHWHSL